MDKVYLVHLLEAYESPVFVGAFRSREGAEKFVASLPREQCGKSLGYVYFYESGYSRVFEEVEIKEVVVQ